MTKPNSAKPPKEINSDWFNTDTPSDDLIMIDDGDPGFKIDSNAAEQFKKRLEQKRNAR